MVIYTTSRKAREARRTNVQMILSEHDEHCTTCVRSGRCSLQKLAKELNIQSNPFETHVPEQKGNPHLPKQKGSSRFPLIRDYTKCIKCMRCVQVCDKIQSSNIWDLVGTGSRARVDVCDVYNLEDSNCALCGQCITHCPVGALKERDDVTTVFDALDDPNKVTIVQIAPSIRTSWGESFGLDAGKAALRSAYYLVTGKNPDPDAFRSVRGMDGWKEAEFEIAGNRLKIAVVHGLGNADKLLTALKKGKVSYDFVEVMACPGGCVGGGGQPFYDGVEMAPDRAPILYAFDRTTDLRFSHENPSVIRLYEDYLGKPLGEKAHHLLHTDHRAWKMPNE